jgi:hypothetical protein
MQAGRGWSRWFGPEKSPHKPTSRREAMGRHCDLNGSALFEDAFGIQAA